MRDNRVTSRRIWRKTKKLEGRKHFRMWRRKRREEGNGGAKKMSSGSDMLRREGKNIDRRSRRDLSLGFILLNAGNGLLS